nr:ABC transporter ATP-binding protein [Kaustia mangrovi]
MPTPRLELTGIVKRYPGVLANDRVDLAVMPGEIHALLGENGAGKSTLVKIIYGVVQADEGDIRWDGRPVRIADPHAARKLGIGMVFQHFNLFETLTVAENILLGLDGRSDLKALSAEIAEVAERYGLAVNPHRHVHALSVGERQRVEIMRCLLQDPRLIVMDEPTSVLTPQEADGLFVTLRRLAGEGRSVLYISHKLEEIQALCDTATVLRGGRVSGHCVPREETPASLARMMIGHELPHVARHRRREPGRPVLAVEGLSVPAPDPHGTDLKDISFTVREGEVLGIAGVAGNGQRTLLGALNGETAAPAPGMIAMDGVAVGRLSAGRRRARGLAHVPEERLSRGAVPAMSLARNTLLTAHRKGLVRHGLIDFARTRAFAQGIIERFRVAAPGPRRRRAACRAAICRNSSSAARSRWSRAFWCSAIPHGASMSARPPRSARRSSTSRRRARRSSSCRRISTSCSRSATGSR